MRSARVHLAWTMLLAAPFVGPGAGAETRTSGVERESFEAYAVVCSHASTARVDAGGPADEVIYSGVVLSDDRRVAGTLSIVVSFPSNARRAYTGRITVQPRTLEGTGTWEGRFGGELRRGQRPEDPAALGLELLHRRTATVPRNPSTIRVPGPPRTRTVCRMLRGTGALEGLRLVFQHPANDGEPPAAAALPAGCLSDYERWSGALLDLRSLKSRRSS